MGVFEDGDGTLTSRLISFGFHRTIVNAFCLEREGPRNFRIERIQNVELAPAHEATVRSQTE